MCGCGAGAWGWSSLEQLCTGSLLRGAAVGSWEGQGSRSSPRGPSPHSLSAHAPAVQALPTPRPRVPGVQHDLALGAAAPAAAGAGQWEQEQNAGLGTSSISGASPPSTVQALIHIFIRINEAYNKCIGEAKQAAERQSRWMRAGEDEEQSGHCADLGSCMGTCWSGCVHVA